jgi:hypothetical protein
VNWLAHVLGLDSASGYWYLFWSGIGSDITELAIVGALVSVYRKHACHEPWCVRLGRHPVEGTPFAACRRHHPALKGEKPKRGHMTAAWHAARRSRSDVGGERMHRRGDGP